MTTTDTKIKLKRTSTKGKVIDSSKLEYGELAINYKDGNLQWKNADGEVQTTQLKTYVHTQNVAADTWTVTHNLGKYPSVTVTDTANTVFYCSVQYDSLNSCTISMSVPIKGFAYLN